MHRTGKIKLFLLLCLGLLMLSGCGQRQASLPQDSSFSSESLPEGQKETEGLSGAESADGQSETGAGKDNSQETGGETGGVLSDASGKETGASRPTAESSFGGGAGKPGENAGETQENSPEQPGNSSGGNVQTSPPPSEEKPEEPKDITCTISIDCRTILDNMKNLKAGHEAFVPADGWLLKETAVTVKEGTTVLEVLTEVCRENGLSLEQSAGYIKGIQQLHEKDCGRWSGWMYQVNGTFPNTGCGSYQLSGGEQNCWRYTCDMGNDLK